MKHRLLVMNGQRLVQAEKNAEWVVTKVDKAGAIKPGIYPLTGARKAAHGERNEGVVLHVDREHVYQQVGREVVAYDASHFARAPQVGAVAAISYEKQAATVNQSPAQLRKGIKR